MSSKKSQRTGEVRIIGGKWKGRKIRFPEIPALRPTLGRTRETLFNWLRPDLGRTRCLDLFAGSGILGLEALSQGAEHVTFVESNRRAAQSLQSVVAHLEGDADVICDDARRACQRLTQPFDVIFLDPPFADKALIQTCCDLLGARGLIGDRVYLESSTKDDITPLVVALGCEIERDTRAGDARGYLLRRQLGNDNRRPGADA